MPSPDDETTDWQREMAVEIKREIARRPGNVLTRHESQYVDGDGYTTAVDFEVKPAFSVLVLVRQAGSPDHVPRTVEGVDVELEHGAFVTRFTVDCEWVSGDGTGDFLSLWYRCSVVD